MLPKDFQKEMARRMSGKGIKSIMISAGRARRIRGAGRAERGKGKIKYSKVREKKISDIFAHRYHGWNNRANGKGFEKAGSKWISPMQLPCFFSCFSTKNFLPGHVFLWTLASSTLLIHYNFTEYPVVFFSAIIEELPLISLAIGISSLNKFNNINNYN